MERYVDMSPYEDCYIVRNREDTGFPVKDLPTAIPVHARWKVVNNQMYSPFDTMTDENVYVCTRCQRKQDKASRYCPNCGAKMDKEEI